MVVALPLLALVWQINISLHFDSHYQLSWFWAFNALAALYIANEPAIYTSWLRRLVFVLALLAVIEMAAFSRSDGQFGPELLLSYALDAIEIFVLSLFFSELDLNSRRSSDRYLIGLGLRVAGLLVLTAGLQSVTYSSTGAIAFLPHWIGGFLAQFVPTLLVFSYVHANSYSTATTINWRHVAIPLAAGLYLVSESTGLLSPQLHLVYFALAMCVLLFLPFKHTAFALFFFVAFEFYTLPGHLAEWNLLLSTDAAPVTLIDASAPMGMITTLLLGLAFSNQRSFAKAERLEMLDRSLSEGLTIGDMHVFEVDLQSGIATSVGGRGMLVRSQSFHLRSCLKTIVAPHDQERALALIEKRDASETLKFVDPETGKFVFYAKVSLGTSYERDGRRYVLMVRQIVTELVEKGYQLEASLAMRRMAVDEMGLRGWLIDVDTLEAEQFIGTEQLGADAFVEAVRASVSPADFKDWLTHIEDESPSSAEYECHVKNVATPLWFRSTFGPVFLRDFRRKRYLLSQDITEIKQQQFALEDTETTLETATDASDILVFRHDLSNDRLWINKAGRRMLNVPASEASEHSFKEFEGYMPKLAFAQIKQVINRLSKGVDAATADIEFALPTGSVRTLQLSAKRLVKPDSSVINMGTMVDISGPVKMSHELEQALVETENARDELQALYERQKRMFAVIGHELRTPAAAIDMMLRTTDVSSLGEYGSTLKASSSQLLNVLDDLRAVAQVGVVQEAAIERSSAVEIVEQVMHSLRLRLHEQGITMHAEISSRVSGMFEFRAQALRQILTNLLTNVAVHSGAKNVWVSLVPGRRSKFSGHSCLALQVEDDGKGIPAAMHTKVFEAFYRVDTDVEGTGLGLSIAQNLAESLNGTIEYFDGEHNGAGFRVLMNLVAIADSDNSEDEVEMVSLQGLRVLLAEDNPTIQLLTKAMLAKEGADVTAADNGALALDIYRKSPEFDFVLTDIFMPEMDGYGLTRALRKAGFDKPIIGVSAATVGEEVDLLVEAGATLAMAKPLTMKKLKESLLKVQGQQQ